MAITADILDYPLSEMLFFLASRNASGHLTVSSTDIEVSLTINLGEIVASESNDRRQRLGQRMVAAGAISEEQLTTVIDHLTNHPGATTIGRAVIELGYLTAGEVQEALQAQWTEQLFQILIRGHEGRFTFEPGPTSLHGITAEIGAQGLVFEAMRRADEWLDKQLRSQPLHIAAQVDQEHSDLVSLDDIRILHLLALGPLTADYLSSWLDLEMETVVTSLHRLYASRLVLLPPELTDPVPDEAEDNDGLHQPEDWHPRLAIPVIKGIHGEVQRKMVAS